MSHSLDVALIELTSIDDVDANVAQILAQLQTLESAPPDLVCLPENAIYFRLRDGVKPPALALESPSIVRLAEWAKRFDCAIHVGSIPLGENGRTLSASVLITPQGASADYRKIHLFDVDVEGLKPVRESDIFAAGEKPFVFEWRGWKFGSSICYDVRFSELYLAYAKLGVDAILVPAAFLVPTGRAHWEVLTRARAIETQSYVLAAAQGGEHRTADGASVRSTYGRSIAIDPWGEILAVQGSPAEERVLRVTLSRDRINQVRRQIPVANHRRL